MDGWMNGWDGKRRNEMDGMTRMTERLFEGERKRERNRNRERGNLPGSPQAHIHHDRQVILTARREKPKHSLVRVPPKPGLQVS